MIQYLIELSKLFKVSTDYILDLDTSEMVDISYLDSEERRMIYFMLDYFKRYGRLVRNFNRQIEEDYDIIKKEADKISAKAVKNILNELMAMKELD